MANAPGWDKLIEGLYIEAAQQPHLDILGDFFYAVLLIQMMFALYIKTEDVGTTVIVTFIITASAASFLPVQISGIMFRVLLVGIAGGILYKLFL